MTKENEIKATKGSTNVFADLGLDDAEELATRAELGRSIRLILKDRGYKQKKAADILGATQAEISQLMNGRYNIFSEGRLISFLNRLDYTVTLHITPTNEGEAQQQVVYA